MQKKKVLIPIVAMATILTVGYLLLGGQTDDDESTLTLFGNVDIREAQLAFNSSEHIKEIFVQEGDRVKHGQLLATLHSKLLSTQLAEAEAMLLAQQLVVAKLEAGNRPQEIRKVEAEYEATKARAKAANDTYQRMQELLNNKLATPDDVENLRSQADVANAQMAAAKASLALLKAGSRKEDIAIAQAQLAAREAALSMVKQNLEHASLIAPADGIIRNRILEPGAMAFPQTPVLTLAFTDPIWVRVYLSETVLGKVSLGAKAIITTDSYPDKTYEGWVGYISPTAEFTPKNVQTAELRTRLVYSAKIYACNPQGELRLGMPATVSVKIGGTAGGTKGDSASNHCGNSGE